MITAAIVVWCVFELWAEQPLSIDEITAAIDRYRKVSIIIGKMIAIITIAFVVIEVLIVIFVFATSRCGHLLENLHRRLRHLTLPLLDATEDHMEREL